LKRVRGLEKKLTGGEVVSPFSDLRKLLNWVRRIRVVKKGKGGGQGITDDWGQGKTGDIISLLMGGHRGKHRGSKGGTQGIASSCDKPPHKVAPLQN